MKKLFTLVAVATFSLVACGPSAEEKAAAEKAKQDSIQAYNDAEAAKAAAEAQRIKRKKEIISFISKKRSDHSLFFFALYQPFLLFYHNS